MGFHPERVVVEAVDEKEWKVLEPFSYEGTRQCFTVPAGMRTDFASVPRIFVWFLPRYGKYTLAAILHDHLWRTVAPAGDIRYVDADGLFRRAMRDLGVPFLRRWIMWAAVRWGALAKRGGRVGWLGQAPRVLLVTLLALPFILPAGVLVGVSLLAFTVFEALMWLPLKLSFEQRRRGGREPRKQVNAPEVEWSA